MKILKTPIRISLFCMVVNLILNLILIGKFLHVGLAIATSISAWINVTILCYYLIFKEKYSFNKSVLTLLIKVHFFIIYGNCFVFYYGKIY